MNGTPVKEKSFGDILIHSFFVIPFLIAMGGMLFFLVIHLMTREPQDASDFLEDVKTGGLTRRWQSAFDLSKILANPDLVPREERFFSDLAHAFKHARHDDNRVRQYLALAMGRTGHAGFVAPLVESLKEEKEENLAAVIYALGMLGRPEASPALYPYVGHPQARIRSITVVALGSLADPNAVAALRQALDDSEPNVQWGAAVSLAKMGDASGKAVLLNMLDRHYLAQFPAVDAEEQNTLVLTAIEAAASLKDAVLDERLGQLAMTDPDRKVRSAVQQILYKMN
jgi:HEAT repeat protein